MNKLLLVIVVIVVGGGSFFAGTKYEQRKNPSPRQRQQRLQEQGSGSQDGTQRPPGFGRARGGDGFASGEILSREENTLTIKLRDGGSKIILLSDATQITRLRDGNLNDLATGKNILVNGTANADGSITARMIQLRLNEQ